MSTTELGLLLSLVLIGLVACYLDVFRRVLPNWLSGLAYIVGIVGSFVEGGTSMALSALLHSFIVLLLGMGFFSLKAIGGGDAKFYAGLAAWFPLGQALFLFVSVALSGLLLIPIWLVARKLRKPSGPLAGRDDAFSKLPYGVAISIGACVSFAMLASSN